MPRISAPTLAEHRANQRAAVLRAAEEIAVELGAHGVTVSAVAARAGLARPSVYAYFPSAEALLEALVEEGFERWSAALAHGIADTTTPEEVVHAYFATAAASAARGEHRLAGALREAPLTPEVRERLRTSHRRTAAPLAEAARAVGSADPDAALALLTTVLNHCLTRVEGGLDPQVEARTCADFALGGLARLART